MILWLALLVIAAAIVLVVLRHDVRMVLSLAALVLGLLANEVPLVVRTFLASLAREAFVLPICTAMGFAFVLRKTGCDQHLVQLLVVPLRRFWALLIPGVVVVGFVTNIPVVSQAGAASTVGPVVIPLMLAAKISPATAGSALLLGASMGGELFNPGAPELQVVSATMNERFDAERKLAAKEGRDADPWEREVKPTDLVDAARPLAVVQLVVATAVFWWLSLGHERRHRERQPAGEEAAVTTEAFRINYLKAAIPVVPLLLLFVCGPPLSLLDAGPYFVGKGESMTVAGPRLVGAAMLVGMVLALATDWRQAGDGVKSFFEGAGYAYTHVISLIVAATAFGKAAEVVGIQEALHQVIDAGPALLLPIAVVVTALFAWVCGSGIAATQSLFPMLVDPAKKLGVDPVGLGALTSQAAAVGRTMSPVAAVTMVCASLTKADPIDLVRRVAPPLLAGLAVVTAVKFFV